MNLPKVFDDEGKVKKYTEAELKELRGKKTNLPGYEGKVDDLKVGQTVKVTVKFDHAGTIDVDYPVLAIGAPAPGASASGSTTQGTGGGMRMQGPGGMQGGGMMQMDKR